MGCASTVLLVECVRHKFLEVVKGVLKEVNEPSFLPLALRLR